MAIIELEEFWITASACIRGYHAYKDTWKAPIDEQMLCERKPDSAHGTL